ncbi:MAG: alanine racemase [Candidatus Omnitrophica bacterium]|nr:alanine racemase [Candidatus Omnitrophota bacterium]
MEHTWLEIDLSALRYNLRQIKRGLNGKAGILAVVKDNAYGHGIIRISQALVEEKIDYLGISDVSEGRELRAVGINSPILNLGLISQKEEVEEVVNLNISQTVCTKRISCLLDKEAKKRNKRIKVHLKIDTGMGRLGAFVSEATELTEHICKLKNMELEGIFTHFPDAADKKFTLSQIKGFNAFLQKLTKQGINFTYQHSANSLAFLGLSKSWFNLIRSGLILYGVYPQASLRKKIELKPVLSWKTKVAYIKDIPKGWSVGYGRTYTAQRKERIAILPVGYGDGYFYRLSNKGRILIKGKFFPVVGSVCMDTVMVRIDKDIKIGDEVVIIGRQKAQQIKVEELAKLSQTIPYEVVCRLSQLPHRFIDKLNKL